MKKIPMMMVAAMAILLVSCGGNSKEASEVPTNAADSAAATDTAKVKAEAVEVEKDCTTCGGTGKMECSKCKGKGYKTKSFRFDYGDGSPAVKEVWHEGCKSCGGRGQDGEGSSGRYTKGSGETKCTDCNGTGKA